MVFSWSLVRLNKLLRSCGGIRSDLWTKTYTLALGLICLRDSTVFLKYANSFCPSAELPASDCKEDTDNT